MCRGGRGLDLFNAMKNKTLFYINLALIVGLILIVLLNIKTNMLIPHRAEVIKGPERHGPSAEAKIKETVYDISKLRPAGATTVKKPPSDLNDMYANFPQSDVGDNMIEGWSKVDPQDKEKFIGVVDKKIDESKKLLAANPKNKRAKHMLFISESLKKMTKDNFNSRIEGMPARE